MANVMIQDLSKKNGNTYLTAVADGQEVFVGVTPYTVTVVVSNAAHKAYRGPGKVFSSVEKALANYKKANIRAVIELAAEKHTANA